MLLGRPDANIAFSRLCVLLGRIGFNERVRGDHHIFTMRGVEEILNLQPREGKAKSYQVKQVGNIILKYDLRIGE
ncbi:MAG: toxin HicA [Gemmatimonadaceae bacterium 4484_173]|nr:MAG: toxin HicA [Gemmatimonadaceae bacterium 4484_173]